MNLMNNVEQARAIQTRLFYPKNEERTVQHPTEYCRQHRRYYTHRPSKLWNLPIVQRNINKRLCKSYKPRKKETYTQLLYTKKSQSVTLEKPKDVEDPLSSLPHDKNEADAKFRARNTTVMCYAFSNDQNRSP